MAHRTRLIQATTVLLYMGPLLAGLAGFGPAYLVPFVVLFMMWLVLLRPDSWPQSAGEWLDLRAALAGVTLIASQVFFVVVLFAVGRGIGGVLGFVPLFHPLLPVALSFLSVPLLRLAGPCQAESGTAAASVEEEVFAPHDVPVPPEGKVSELFALSEDGQVGAEILLDHLDGFLETGDSWSRVAALSAALDAGPASEHAALRVAVILRATDPFPQSEFTVPGEMRMAFAAAGNAPDLLSLLALRARALVQKIPGSALYFPPKEVMLALADACGDIATGRALRDLVVVLGRAALADEVAPAKGRVPARGAATRPFATAASAQRA